MIPRINLRYFLGSLFVLLKLFGLLDLNWFWIVLPFWFHWFVGVLIVFVGFPTYAFIRIIKWAFKK